MSKLLPMLSTLLARLRCWPEACDTGSVDTTRRTLFTRGSLALGATLASAGAGATTLFDGSAAQLQALQLRLAALEDRDAILTLQAAFAALLQQQQYSALAALCSPHAVLELPGLQSAGSTWCSAQRSTPGAAPDQVEIAADGRSARGSFPRQLLVSTALPEAGSLTQMAQLQGQSASNQWHDGRFEVRYQRETAQWRITELRWVSH